MGTEWWLINIDDLTPQSVWKVYGYSFPCEKDLIRHVYTGFFKLPSVCEKVGWRKTFESEHGWCWPQHLLHIIYLHNVLHEDDLCEWWSLTVPSRYPWIQVWTSFNRASSNISKPFCIRNQMARKQWMSLTALSLWAELILPKTCVGYNPLHACLS